LKTTYAGSSARRQACWNNIRTPRMKRAGSCLQVQIIGDREELENVIRLRHERNGAGVEQPRTRIRYIIAARLKHSTRKTMSACIFHPRQTKRTHLVIAPRLIACRISVFNRLSVLLLTNSARGCSSEADVTYDRIPVRLAFNR